MLTLLADQPECLWDDALPVEVSHEDGSRSRSATPRERIRRRSRRAVTARQSPAPHRTQREDPAPSKTVSAGSMINVRPRMQRWPAGLQDGEMVLLEFER